MEVNFHSKPNMNLSSTLEVFSMWVSMILLTSIPLVRGSIGLIGAIFGESIEFVFRSLLPFCLTLMAFVSNKDNRLYWSKKVDGWMKFVKRKKK